MFVNVQVNKGTRERWNPSSYLGLATRLVMFALVGVLSVGKDSGQHYLNAFARKDTLEDNIDRAN